MAPPSDSGRHIEILFTDADQVVDVDVDDEDPAVTGVLVDAIHRSDSDAAERVLRDGGATCTVRNRL
jgi:hypothetical protein